MGNILKNELFEAFANASEFVYIYVCDMKKDESRWSKTSVYYFDLPGEYMSGAGAIWNEKIHPDDRELYNEDISAVFEGKKSQHSCQYRAMNRYGKYVWLECRGSVICDENGKPSVFAGLMTRLDGQNKYDSLTGLMTTHELCHYNFSEGTGTVLLLGIDDFRRVISNYGYGFGDEVLVEFARKISELCFLAHSVYRFSGDEFLVALPGGTKEEAEEIYQRIREAGERFVVRNRRVSLSVSAGAVQYPADGNDREVLVNRLEHSLDYAKNYYRGGVVFFSKEIADLHKRMLVLKEDLKECIHKDFKGFELYFQPWVVPGTQKISGCEALLRWKGEKVTDSYPGEFIRVLEEDGSIRQVGLWVMEQALKQQKEWAEQYGDFYVSFNVSYQQLMDLTFVDNLIAKAEEYEVDPSHVVVELTESCQVENAESLAAMFQRLRDGGFQIALDDFGTAYASLEMLKKLPVNYIKIEHSFVREIAVEGHEIDLAIIKSLLALCRQLNYESVVEGVENQEVAEIIGRMDATYLQGYYYSKPVCKEEFVKMLAEQ